MTTEEHNPDGLTPEQYGAPEWRLLKLGEAQAATDEYFWEQWKTNCPEDEGRIIGSTDFAYRRRVSTEAEGGAPCVSQEARRERDCVISDLKREAADLRAENERLTSALETIGKNYRGVQQARDQNAINFRKANVRIAALERELTTEKQRREAYQSDCDTLRADCESLRGEIATLQREIAGAVDNEQARWQDALDALFAKLVPDANIDGGGCDSGDPLDFSISEISQAIQHVERKAESALAAAQEEVKRLKKALVAAHDELTNGNSNAGTRAEVATLTGRILTGGQPQ